MVLNVYREGPNKGENSLNHITENDSVEIQRIKELLTIFELDYISDTLRHILGITKENKLECFDKKNNEYRVIDGNKRFRVILYIRLSVEDGDVIDGDVSKSIRNQLLYLLSECKTRNWEVVAIFGEEGISGADDNRPEWLKALRYCECGNTEIFLCKSQSRFSRSMEMIEKYLHKEFVSWNIRFVGLVDNTDTSVQGNKKARQINGLVNEWMVEDQSINTRNILKNKKSNGLYTGSFAPYGYIKDPKDKYRLIIDEPAATVVREIFKLYSEGIGCPSICSKLNNEGVPTPSEYKKIKGSNFYSGTSPINKKVIYKVEKNDTIEKIACATHSSIDIIKEYNNLSSDKLYEGQVLTIPMRCAWSTFAVRKILKNETYIGTLVQGKSQGKSYKDRTPIAIPEQDWIKVPHCHNAIIDKDTWELVSNRFKEQGRIKPTNTGEIHLFSKKVYCLCCGKAFQKNCGKTKQGKIDYMNCRESKKTNNFCCNNSRMVRYDVLENFVLEQINNLIKKYYEMSKVEKEYYERKVEEDVESNIKFIENEITYYSTEIVKKQNALTILYDDRVSGIITAEEFALIKRQYSDDINKFNEKIKKNNEKIAKLKKEMEKNKTQEKLLTKYGEITKLTRVIVDEFIDKIYIGNVDPKTKKRKFQIEWNINLS